MKIGLFGGTFNPVHYGHLINAEIIRESFKLDKILFIPSKHPVHKELQGNVSPEDRFNMIMLAVEDNPFFDVSRIEMDRKDESYFIFTLKQLFELNLQADLSVIIGTDAFNEVDKWKNFMEILKLVSFIVMKRPGYNILNKKIIKFAKDIKFIDNPLIDISSSMIREYIGQKRSIKYLVPEKVEKYIREKGLYKI